MKLLTLNTHSKIESEYEKKLDIFADTIKKHMPDVIALQEVMQSKAAKPVKENIDVLGRVPLKEDNHLLRIKDAFEKRGLEYNYMWLGIKQSYSIYEEGLAIITPHKVEEERAVNLTQTDDYYNWRTRKSLMAKICGCSFFCVHLGWWDDTESPFSYQWDKLNSEASKEIKAYLMGDFNSPSDRTGEGYSKIISDGWYDTYKLALNKDNGITAMGEIDGWNGIKEEMRIDYIFTRQNDKCESSYTVFNGKNESIISDHFGIIVTIN